MSNSNSATCYPMVTAARKEPKIVIIGAGVAGLAAAQKLTNDYGFRDVLLLEAHDRIGGRVQTMSYGKGVLELGAQWIHGEEGNPVFAYANDKSLLSDPKVDYSVEGTGHFMDSDGNYLDKNLVEEVVMALDSIKEELPCCRGSSESVGSFYKRRFCKYLIDTKDFDHNWKVKVGLYDWYKRFEVIDNACESLENLSVNGFCEWTDCPGVPLINFKSGFSTLIDSLCKALPKKCVFTKMPVKYVDWNKSQSRSPAIVHCENGQQFCADHVVITSSLGFLKNNWETFFLPKLPVSRKCVLDSFGFGTVNKLYFIFGERFWNDGDLGFQLIWTSCNSALKTLTENHPWVRDISGFDTVRGQPNALVGWIGGIGAVNVENESDAVVTSVCVRLLRIFMGRQSIPLPIHLFRKSINPNFSEGIQMRMDHESEKLNQMELEEPETARKVLHTWFTVPVPITFPSYPVLQGNNVAGPRGMNISKWYTDAYVRGAYSHRLNGYKQLESSLLSSPICLRENIADTETWPVLLFAGEATDRQYFSSVHGALQSGWREADRINNFWSQTSAKVKPRI